MNPLTGWIVSGCVAYCLSWIARRYKWKIWPCVFYFIQFLSASLIWGLQVYSYDQWLEAQVNSFDVNGNGMFDEALTPEQDRIYAAYIGDGGRNVGVIMFSVIYFCTACLLSLLHFFISKMRSKNKTKS